MNRGRSLGRLLSIAVLGVVLAGGLAGCHGEVHAQTVISGLDNPTSFTIGPDNGTIWYSERFSGEIRRRDLSNGQDTLVYRVTNVATGQEQGLFGLALHPGYPTTRLLYAFATRNTGFGPVNQILRITLSAAGLGTAATSIANDGGASANNNGGRILFGPDGMLYGAFGSHSENANAQNLSILSGKVSRLTPDGAGPADNPFADKRLWAYGFRNAFGFDFDPVNGRLWLIDNGPECNDEVDLVVRGGNYGWGPNATCGPPGPPTNTNRDGPTPRVLPEHLYTTPSIGPTGAGFCDGCGLGDASEDTLLFGTANDGHIHQLTLDAGRDDIASDEIIYDHGGPVLSIETRPGQPVYFSDFAGIYKLTLAG
jgi:glucose/arabinose dehydrogenase